MKEYLRTLLREALTPVHARNVVREYLQARLLGALQSAGAMIPLAFHGGTALRFLFGIARYSEDLDFALEGDRAQYDFRGYLRAIQGELSAEGYALRLKVNDRKTVHGAFVHFDGLLYEMGLSPHRKESMAVKIEVDTRPPAGAVLTTTVVRRHETLQLQHHDRASLLAGKLHALMQRSYTKGRDVYDLLWYLSDRDWPEPNLTLLNNALKQTSGPDVAVTPERWREVLRTRLQDLSWNEVVADVAPFLERENEAPLLTRENVMRALQWMGNG